MKYTKNIFGLLMLLSFASVAFGQLTILSGSSQATQYSLVQDIATIVADTLGFKIENKSTNGAADNFNQLVDPKSPYKLAILQADYLYFMKAQDMRVNTEKTKNLKVVVPLGYQQIHLVTKTGRGINGLKDLNGKVVSLGSEDQGTYRTASIIKERSQGNWTAVNTPFEDCFRDLTTDQISAFFIVSSAPIQKLDVDPQSMGVQLSLVPLVNYNDWAKYYKADTIHKSDYKWLDHDVPTFSVPSVLVVNESKLTGNDHDEIMKLKSGMQSKMPELKATGHPQWKKINLQDWDESNWPLYK